MKAKRIIDRVESGQRSKKYLAQCRNRSIVEDSDTHVPPTSDEVTGLIGWLRKQGLQPLIVGSLGVLSFLSIDPSSGFRPTVDVDIWVDKMPQSIPDGWDVDTSAIGVPSWISPSGGYVDFLLPNQDLPSGKTPARIDPDPETKDTDFPVASWKSLLKLKLNSYREKDLADSIALVRSMGQVPSAKELGKLNRTQADNLDLVARWFELRPHGNYGE